MVLFKENNKNKPRVL